jgi:NADPH:quinone reductase-like Zn-dependent oxidoreductase
MNEPKKAVQFEKTGNPPDVVELVEIETEKIQSDEALIDVLAAAINPAHLLTLQGDYGIQPKLPAIPGAEGIGRIVKVGKAVKDVDPGDLVMIPPYSGTWRQQLVVPANRITVKFPNDGDPVQMSMLMANPPTAWLLLKSVVDLNPGDWVIQNAANSAVGQYVMQLAKIYGFHTVNVVRRKGLELMIEEAGGDVCIVDGTNLESRVKSATNNANIRLGIDAVAGDNTQHLANCLSDDGIIANYGLLSGSPCRLDPSDIIFRNISLKGVWLTQWLKGRNSTQDLRLKVYEELLGYIVNGRLQANIEAIYPLEDIKKAVSHAMQAGRNGKIVLKPNN